MLQTQNETLLAKQSSEATNKEPQYTVELATNPDDILAAQRLRYRVFAEEMGARLKVRHPGVDSDLYDPYCEHLVVRDNVADMVLVHGGDSKGVDRLAAAWAECRKVPQVTFGLDSRLGQRAGFRRNEQMLSLNPRYLVAFAGNGVLERLVIQAKERRIAVVDRRGPLGTNPKRAAVLSVAA